MNHESNKSETLIVIRFNKQLSGEFYVRIRVYLVTKTLYENILRCRTTKWKKAYQDIIKNCLESELMRYLFMTLSNDEQWG